MNIITWWRERRAKRARNKQLEKNLRVSLAREVLWNTDRGRDPGKYEGRDRPIPVLSTAVGKSSHLPPREEDSDSLLTGMMVGAILNDTGPISLPEERPWSGGGGESAGGGASGSWDSSGTSGSSNDSSDS